MSKISKIKKFLPCILLFAAIIAGVLGPLGAKVSYATSWWDLFTDPRIALLTLTGHAANIGLTVFSYAVEISAAFLQFSVNESINHMKDYTSMVKPGWTITRDIANLFFIFILLYISIATVLQLSGYGMKELLTRVIIIALLVNFSLMITNVIIDSSNILAVEFFNKVTKIKWEQEDASGEVTTATTTDMAGAIVGGMKLQSLFQAIDVFSVKTEECTKTAAKVEENVFGGKYCYGTAKRCPVYVDDDTIDDSGYCCNCTTVKEETLDTQEVLMRIFIVGIGGIIFELVTAFVLFAAGCLFATRLAILLILMMLAPLAFLAMALPKTQSYAKQWWDKLFNQAFFAPAYLFLFYLIVKIVAEGNLIDKLGASQTSLATSFASPDDANVPIILNFVIIIFLMLACLIIAKQMGAMGASTVQSWGQSAKKWGQAKAGKISRRGAGWAAERMLDKGDEEGKDKRGRIAKFGGWAAGKIPFANRGLAKLSGMREQENKKRQKDYEKEYGSYTDVGLATLEKDPTLISKVKREAIQNIMKKRQADKIKNQRLEEDKERYKELTKKDKSTGKSQIESLEEQTEKEKMEEMELELKLDGLKMELPTDENKKKQQEYVIRIKKIKEEREKSKDLKEEKKKLKDKLDLEERFGEMEGKISSTAEKEKAKPPSAPKT